MTSVPSTVFDGVLGEALLMTGRSVVISDAQPDDFDSVRAFYDTLGSSSTYLRFFGPRKFIPDGELRAAVAHHVPQHVTLLASMQGSLIGIGEFVVGGDPVEAEVAFAVADTHQHEGVATLLLERLAIVGRRCGLERFVAKTMFMNQDMRVVFRTVGLTQSSAVEDGYVDVTLDLTSLAELEQHMIARRRVAVRAAESIVC